MTPNYNGEALTRMVDKWTYGFVKNDVCSYLVTVPSEMDKDDKIYVKIDKILNCQVYIAKGKNYRWLEHLDKQVVYDNDVFEMQGNNLEFYIVGVATSVSRGQFRIQTWIEKDVAEVDNTVYKPPGVIETNEPEEVVVPTTRPFAVDSSVNADADGNSTSTNSAGDATQSSESDDDSSGFTAPSLVVDGSNVTTENTGVDGSGESDTTPECLEMQMQDNYESITNMPECMKLVHMKNGQKLIFNANNEFVDIYQEQTGQETFGNVQLNTQGSKQVTIESPYQDDYTDYSSLVIGLVVALLFMGVGGVLGFLQYKFVICKQFLCLKCRKKGKGMQIYTGTTPTPNEGATAGGPTDDGQFNANDLIRKRQKWNDELAEEDDEDDTESQQDFHSKNMLNNELHSAQEINPDNRSLNGSGLGKTKQSTMDQEQMFKMFEMFQ